MIENLSLEITADGSATLRRKDLDEHYHSVKGALTESRHVYLDCGWREAAARFDTVRVFEVGFGTGLNAAITASAARECGHMTEFFSVELHPLPDNVWHGLTSHVPSELREHFEAVNSARWNITEEINSRFRLTKLHSDLLSVSLPEHISAVYYDAFAPEKQPEMWDEMTFRRLYAAMSNGGVLTTYCTKGIIRRMLASVGFNVSRLSGPPGGKREILRALKP